MIKIELFDGYSNEKLDIPFIIQYKSGLRWYTYPPSVADLTLSTQRKRFKIIVDVPSDTSVSGLVGIKVVVGGKEITFNEDPLWFINGNPVDVQILKECKTHSESTYKPITLQVIAYQNKTICADEPINLSCERINIKNSTYSVHSGDYIIEISNTTICKNTGFHIRNKIIDFAEVEWNCARDKNELCCEAPHQSDQNGICSSGEGYCIFNILTLEKECTVSKTRQIKELNVR